MEKGNRPKNGRTVDIVWNILDPFAEKHEIDIVDIEYVKEGSDWFLRVIIDFDNRAVTTDDCQMVSEYLSDKLDDEDPIKDQYFLEVSSPGLERLLKREKDFKRFSGHNVKIGLYKTIDGLKNFEARLVGLKDDNIEVMLGDNTLSIPRSSVSSVRLIYNFELGGKK